MDAIYNRPLLERVLKFVIKEAVGVAGFLIAQSDSFRFVIKAHGQIMKRLFLLADAFVRGFWMRDGELRAGRADFSAEPPAAPGGFIWTA